jgi:hypothetical protein
MTAQLNVPLIPLYVLFGRLREFQLWADLVFLSFSEDGERTLIDWSGINDLNGNVEFASNLIRLLGVDVGTLDVYENGETLRHYVIVTVPASEPARV